MDLVGVDKSDTTYLPSENNTEKLVRIELIFAPLLVLFPVVVSLAMLWGWFSQGYLEGSSGYDGQLLIACVILACNILFDIPFLRSLILFSKEKRQ